MMGRAFSELMGDRQRAVAGRAENSREQQEEREAEAEAEAEVEGTGSCGESREEQK